MKPEKKTYCSRLVYQWPGQPNPSVILGLVIHDDGKHITFKTGRRSYFLKKEHIISIEETNTPFHNDEDDAL